MREIDLVFSGSGVKMMAFAGALKAVEEAGLKVRRLAGTSGGAIVGSMYAAGMTPDQIKDTIMEWNFKKWVWAGVRPWAWARWGIVSSRPIQKALEKAYGKKTFADDLKCELWVSGANVSMGRTDFFRPEGARNLKMKLSYAARISGSVPLAFAWVKWNNHAYVDGGLYKNYPIDIFDDHSRPTIGVKVNGQRVQPRKHRSWNPISYILALLESASEAAEREHIEDADWARTILLQADQITHALNMNLTKEQKEQLFQMGYEETKKQLPNLL